jgi:hypothetical protein
VVCNPRRNALLKEGSKSDKIDARKLAELLRAGLLRAVYHGENGLQTLRELARSYLTISKDLKRVQKSAQGVVPQLGHLLRRQAGLCRTPWGTMVEQDCAGRRAPPRGAVLSAAGWTTCFAEHRAWRTVGCAGINRHEAGNERFLRERSSEPLGPEFCAVYREVHGEA